MPFVRDQISFSLIVPFDGRIDLVKDLIEVWAMQKEGRYHHSELILIYDGEISELPSISLKLALYKYGGTKLVATGEKSGPGPARNLGILNSVMDYLFFLDSDDLLVPNALDSIAQELVLNKETEVDILNFNWRLDIESEESKLPRRDYRWLTDSCIAFEQFTKHHMEGSCIFSVYSTRLVKTNQLTFPTGLHEDIHFHAKSLFLAQEIDYLDKVIYIKRNFGDGLTSVWNQSRINDYLGAYSTIVNLAETIHFCGKTHDEFASLTIPSAIASLCLKIPDDDFEIYFGLLKCIHESWFKENYKDSLPRLTIYSRVLKLLFSFDESTPEKMKSLKSTSLSCKDLHRSVYLAPNEIRTCCKRFFVEGEMKGDVRLIQVSEKNKARKRSVSARDIKLAKRDLYLNINYGEKTDCDGCPFIELSDWDKLESNLDIQLLSMEQHSVCNLRCTYCDDTYYGGLRENYDVGGLLQDLSATGSLDNLELVVWGGGEPVLDPMFKSYVGTVNEKSKNVVNRFLSNSLRFSESIADEIAGGSGLLVTSIDAGSEKTFKEIRGRGGFEKVWKNLQQYAAFDASRITIKYIFTKGNHTQNDIEGFLSKIVEYSLSDCFFQISSDFKDEVLGHNTIELVLYLFNRLNEIGCRFAYLDDLIWQRWSEQSRNNVWNAEFDLIGDKLRTSVLADPKLNEGLVFWGANQLTKLLLSSTEFRKRWNIVGIVDSNPQLWNTTISGIRVYPPGELTYADCKIFLSGIQSIHKLFFSLSEYGLSSSQVLRKILW
jgi:sulfatase maturation enzyme AslB (radical SAM superfamily)/glycosyltransferase involved in cell wall biosynthesis